MGDLFSSFAENFGTTDTVEDTPKDETAVHSDVQNSKKIDNSAYRAYVQAVESYDDIVNSLENAKKVAESASREERSYKNKCVQMESDYEREIARIESNYEKEIAHIENDYKRKISLKEQEKKTAKTLSSEKTTEIGNQNDPNSASSRRLRYVRPTQDEEVMQVLNETSDLFSQNQCNMLALSVEEVCGNDIYNDEVFRKLERTFKTGQIYKQLVSGVPSTDFVYSALSKIPLIIALVFFIIILLAGISSSVIVQYIMYGICMLTIVPTLGTLVSKISYFIIKAIIASHKEESILSKILSWIFGYGIIGISVASSLAVSVTQILGDSVIAKVIVGLVIGVVVFILIRKLLKTPKVLEMFQKSEFMQNRMRKHLFLDNDSDTQLALQLYAFIHHNQICDYFENEFRKSTIRRLEQEIAELEIQVRRCDEDIQKLEEDKVSVLARKEKDKTSALAIKKKDRASARAIEEENFKKLNDSIIRAKDDVRKYTQLLDNAMRAIESWKDSPELDETNNISLKPYICVQGKRVNFNILKLKDTKGSSFKISYASDSDMENLSELVKSVVMAFTKMNPYDMVDITVICLSNKASLIKRRTAREIPWVKTSQNVAGGNGTQKEGHIALIKDVIELRDFVKILKKRYDEQDAYYDQNADSIDGIALCDINKYRAERSSAPFKYQVILVVAEEYDHEEERAYNEMFSVIETLNDSCIRFTFLPKGVQTGELWNK